MPRTARMAAIRDFAVENMICLLSFLWSCEEAGNGPLDRGSLSVPLVRRRGTDDHRRRLPPVDEAGELAIAMTARGEVVIDEAGAAPGTEPGMSRARDRPDLEVTLLAVVGRPEAAPVVECLRSLLWRRVEITGDLAVASVDGGRDGARVGLDQLPGGGIEDPCGPARQ